MLNVDRSGLLTICIYSHTRWISFIPIPDISPAYLVRQHQNLHSSTMKHELSSIAEQPWHPRLCTQYSANRLTTTSVLGFPSRMGFGGEVGKGNYTEETDRRYSMRRKCAVEERSHLMENIRKLVLPFVRLFSVSHHIHYFIHLVFLLSCRSHSLPYTIPLSLVSLITFLYPNCSYQ